MRSSGYTTGMSGSGKVIIVVDVLNGFCRFGNLSSPRLGSVVPAIREYLARELKAGARAVFLVDTHTPDDPEFLMFPPHCIEGSGEDEIVDELKEFAQRSVVLRKRRYSGFFGTDLERVLADMAPDEVEVVGVCTDICVLHTVAGLRARGYEVLVRRDLVETYDAPGHVAEEFNRFALAHFADVLGARVE
jgi:nicotinamidase/pyrazinamidase